MGNHQQDQSTSGPTVDEVAPDELTDATTAASRRIEELVLEAIDGPAEPLTATYKEDLRREVRAYAAGRADD